MAVPDYGDAVGHAYKLAELVGDEDDGEPVGDQFLQDGEQVLGLLGRQDGGRFVEDHDAGVAVEGLEDLHPLLLPYREVRDPGPGIHPQPVALGELLRVFYGLGEVQGGPLARLGAEHDVLRHGEGWYQGEVLVDHPDAAGYGVLRVVYLHLLAVHEDGAGVRGVEAVEDLHQGGLARPVLAEEAEDLTPAQRDGDVVVGPDGPERLGDVTHLEYDRGLPRGPGPPLSCPPLGQLSSTAAACRGPLCRR